MEINPVHKNYRDTLAAKLKHERSTNDREKARRILDEQRGTEFYADAKKDHQEYEQKPKRLESVAANLESLKARIETLQALEQKILGAENISKNETPASTEEDKADKQASQEGFNLEQEKIEDEQEALLREKESLEKELAETSVNPEVPTGEKYQGWTDQELKAKYETIKGSLLAAKEHGAQSHKDSVQELEAALKKRGISYEPFLEDHADANKVEKEASVISEEAATESDFTAHENKVGQDVSAAHEKYGQWSDAELLEAYRDNKEKLGIVAHLKPELLNKAVADLEAAVRKRGLISDQEQVSTPPSLEQAVNDAQGSVAIERPEPSPTEHSESSKKLLPWLAIAASTQKSLDWMRGKNAAWTTPSMIAREERKLKQAQEALAEGKGHEQHEDLPTIAGALARAQEKNENLIAAQPERSNWLKRNWRKVVAGGALVGLFTFGAKTCEMKTSDTPHKDRIELPQGSDREDHRIVIEEKEDVFEEVSAVIERGDGVTQVAKKAFEAHPELAERIDLDVTSPESLKAFGERIKIIDLNTGNEVRLDASAIGGKIDFRVYDSGKIVAFFKYNKDRPENVDALRATDDPFTKFEKKSSHEYLNHVQKEIINEGQVVDDGQTADPFNVFKK